MTERNGEQTRPVVVIGAGPIGLAAAAHLHREQRPFAVLEAGSVVGHAIRQWGHVRLFTPWRYLVDDTARELLESNGWTMPDPDAIPTGSELVGRYLERLAGLPALRPHIHTGVRVVSVTRRGLDRAKTAGRADAPFEVIMSADGKERRLWGSAVIDASGTYGSPNPAGSGGVPVIGEVAHGDRFFYGLPDVRGRDRSRYAGRRTGVVGSGHSAFNTLLDLEELVGSDATEVTWFVRSRDMSRLWGGAGADELPERGALGQRMKRLVESGRVAVRTGFSTDEVRETGDGLVLMAADGQISEPLDEVVVVTGFRPDLSLTRELRLDLDPVVESPASLGPLIDPNVHSCGSVPPHGHRELGHPEADFYTVGMKSYGRAPTFLMLTGYEQVRSVVKAICRDVEAADRVDLRLPETGVCSTNNAYATVA